MFELSTLLAHQNKVIKISKYLNVAKQVGFLDQIQVNFTHNGPPTTKVLEAKYFSLKLIILLIKGPFIIYTSGGHRREIGWVTDF